MTLVTTVSLELESVRIDTITSRGSHNFYYCKFRNFSDNFIFPNSVKIHICDVKNLPQWRDLPISVNDE